MTELGKSIIENKDFVKTFNNYLNTVFNEIRETRFESEKIHLHKEFIFWELIESLAKSHKQL